MPTLAQDASSKDAANAPQSAVIWPRFNLNSAASEQFMGIPGAGEKMTREFEEYRPYTSIGQFRAEIGKYVAPEDVAALEAYLFVPVDVNEADADTLQQLPGVNADAAQTLIAGRPFADVDAFVKALEGIAGSELAAAAKAFLAPDAGESAAWVKYDLNTASSEQLMAIPGAGEHMTREFDEYRPYSSIGQFRGEIGKYISPEEVAVLEKYLFVPVDPNTADGDTMQQLPGVTPALVEAVDKQRPFASAEAFVQALQAQVSPELAAAIAPYLTQS
jgi:DNA uptake protein ComE-like DNA-binding protein